MDNQASSRVILVKPPLHRYTNACCSEWRYRTLTSHVTYAQGLVDRATLTGPLRNPSDHRHPHATTTQERHEAKLGRPLVAIVDNRNEVQPPVTGGHEAIHVGDHRRRRPRAEEELLDRAQLAGHEQESYRRTAELGRNRARQSRSRRRDPRRRARHQGVLIDTYKKRYGPQRNDEALTSGPIYFRIEPVRIYAVDLTEVRQANGA